jgi:SAM-dependent methyltransferase
MDSTTNKKGGDVHSDALMAASARQDGPQTMPSDAEGWWETERAKLIRSRILATAPKGGLVVDVGCGRGTMLDHPSLDGLRRVQVDSHVWREWTPRTAQYFVCAEADALPFRSGSFDIVGSFDVLEHLEHDDVGLSEQRRIVRDEGTVLTAVPADQRLWSKHDEAVGHYRRYSTRVFADLATRCGLVIDRSSYFFSFLWIPARLLRNTTARTSEPANDDSIANRLIRLAIGALCAVERGILRLSSLPVGTSIWVESRPADSRGSDHQSGRAS